MTETKNKASDKWRGKCRVTPGVWQLCTPLSAAIGEANVKRRGIGELQTINFKTGKTRTFAVIHRHSATHCGLVLNVCPWCAVAIKPREAKKP